MSGIKLRSWTCYTCVKSRSNCNSNLLHNTNFYSIIVFADTRNFPFPHTIQAMNDFSWGHLPGVHRFQVDNFYLDIPRISRSIGRTCPKAWTPCTSISLRRLSNSCNPSIWKPTSRFISKSIDTSAEDGWKLRTS